MIALEVAQSLPLQLVQACVHLFKIISETDDTKLGAPEIITKFQEYVSSI